MTNGSDGTPPAGVDHVVVVTHRGRPEGWYPVPPFYFGDGFVAAMAKPQELAGDRVVEVAAGDVRGQVLPRVSSTRCAWTSRPSCSGPANATSGRSTRNTCWRILTRRFRATGCSTYAIECAVDQSQRVHEEVHCER